MDEPHGAMIARKWLDDLVEAVRGGAAVHTSAGAEPNRTYAYLEWHDDGGQHSILLFNVEVNDGVPVVHSHRFDGEGTEVGKRVDALVHSKL